MMNCDPLSRFFILDASFPTGSHTLVNHANSGFTSVKNNCTRIPLAESESRLIGATHRCIKVAPKSNVVAKALFANIDSDRRHCRDSDRKGDGNSEREVHFVIRTKTESNSFYAKNERLLAGEPMSSEMLNSSR
jgi:hypothetical protein